LPESFKNLRFARSQETAAAGFLLRGCAFANWLDDDDAVVADRSAGRLGRAI